MTLDRLRDNASRKLFEAVLLHSPDRLARTYVHQEILIDELKKSGVQVVFLNRPLSDTPEDRMLQGMQGLFSEYEKAKIAERARRGKLHKARSGRIVGHMAPFGYQYVKKSEMGEGIYVINEREAKGVRFIFKTFVERQVSLGGLIKLLHKDDIQPRKGGERWQRSSLNRILRNESYIGVTYYNKGRAVEPESRRLRTKYHRVQHTSRRIRPKNEWVPIAVPAIISRRLFDQAQRQLVRNRELSPRRTKNQYLLRGLTRCGQCGCLYAGIPCHGKRQYRCRNKDQRFPLPKNCQARMVSAEIIEPLVWQAVVQTVTKPALILKKFRTLGASIKKQEELTEAQKRQIETTLLSQNIEEQRLLEAYQTGVITLEQFRAQVSGIGAKRKALMKERSLLGRPALNVQRARSRLQHYAGFIRNRIDSWSFEEKQKFLRSLISEITIFDDAVQIKGCIPVDEESLHGVPLCSDSVDAMDTKEPFGFVIVKELRHGKARPSIALAA